MKNLISCDSSWGPVLLGLLISVINSSAASIESLTYDASGDTVTITDCDDRASGALEIPSKIEGKPVTSIGNAAFYECASLTNVTIADTVTSIGDWAFGFCNGLTSITIPDSVDSIGFGAFVGCESLSSITIPEGVSSIGEGAFGNCSSLRSITIPDSVTSVGVGTFSSCISLASITIPDSVTSIGDRAFSRCTRLTSITIPDSVTSIGDSVFSECLSLKEITTTITNPAYSTVSGILYNKSKTLLHTYPLGLADDTFTIPDTVTSIGNRAFEFSQRLSSITIPNSVISIGNYAFFGCSRLSSITNSTNVMSIGDYAFFGCSRLTSITIPDTVTSIGGGAFFGCHRLSNIFFYGDASTNIGAAFSGVSDAAIVTVQPNATGFGSTFGGLPVVFAKVLPPAITRAWIDAEGNFIFKLDGSNTGVKLSYSPDLESDFKTVSDTITQGEDEILIRSTSKELQGSQGFFQLSN